MKKIEEILKLTLNDMQTGINKIDEFRKNNPVRKHDAYHEFNNHFEMILLSNPVYKSI